MTAEPPAGAVVGSDARHLIGQVSTLLSRVEHARTAMASQQEAVTVAFTRLRDDMVRRDLDGMPVERLKESTGGRLRLGAIERGGFRTVLRVLDAPMPRLLALPGVGETTAMQAKAAARQVAEAVRESLKFRVDLDPSNASSTALITALATYDALDQQLQQVATAQSSLERLRADIQAAAPAKSRFRWFFTGAERRSAALEAAQRMSHELESTAISTSRHALDRFEALAGGAPIGREEAWRQFEKRSVEFYGLLERLVGFKHDVAAAEGYLPAEIVDRVNELDLDEMFRSVSLRGYQAFGAKFALVQKRVILGDEMGLGKTIQAIAAMAHLRATSTHHFLVVCPASVLINWLREVREKSRLQAYRLHGPDRDINLRRWLERGEVAVTTFETLKSLAIPADQELSLLVVDEAHYAKNPAAQRSINVRTLAARSKRVMFLTGTPLENRVDEFRNLVSYLQPHIVPRIERRNVFAGAEVFRKAVAPVYLRRNQEDVLSELPELVQVDEWETFSPTDLAAYRQAVAEGNFMAMRRAAFAGTSRESSKLQRLLQITDEAGDNGHKVIVFSYFRDVLDKVHTALGARSVGPLTGDIAPTRRQQLVDRFAAADGHAVLVCQIVAGGVGLNMQAGSVVILCEPQVKPTMETQAIARAHRMGQVRTVQVHRLLVADSVDQRMLDILKSKQRVFDEYARKSDVASVSPEALDVSEVQLARDIVAMEQERLALSGLGLLAQASTMEVESQG